MRGVFISVFFSQFSMGRLVAADEVRAPGGWKRALQLVWRIPQAAVGWLLVGTVSRPVPELAAEIRAAGLQIVEEKAWLMGTLGLISAMRSQ